MKNDMYSTWDAKSACAETQSNFTVKALMSMMRSNSILNFSYISLPYRTLSNVNFS
jgi:hypothetical protein